MTANSWRTSLHWQRTRRSSMRQSISTILLSGSRLESELCVICDAKMQKTKECKDSTSISIKLFPWEKVMSGSLWIWGCVASVVGSTLSNFGVNIQKFSAMKNAEVEFLSFCHSHWRMHSCTVSVSAAAASYQSAKDVLSTANVVCWLDRCYHRCDCGLRCVIARRTIHRCARFVFHDFDVFE